MAALFKTSIFLLLASCENDNFYQKNSLVQSSILSKNLASNLSSTKPVPENLGSDGNAGNIGNAEGVVVIPGITNLVASDPSANSSNSSNSTSFSNPPIISSNDPTGVVNPVTPVIPPATEPITPVTTNPSVPTTVSAPTIPATPTIPTTPTNSNPTVAINIPPAVAICDPFSLQNVTPTPQVNDQHGIIVHLYDGSDFQYKKLDSYFQDSLKVDTNIFFSTINTPNHSFSEGFKTSDGTVLTNSSGQKLFEWFGLLMQGRIILGPNDPEGEYEFATISDDGAELEIDSGNGMESIINYQNTTSAILNCSTVSFKMDHKSSFPFQIKYFQGPRFYIAIMLMWRLKTPQTPSACGNASQATSASNAYKWKTLLAENYLLPQQVPVNPCVAIQGGCRNDVATNTNSYQFILSSQNVNASTIKVYVDGVLSTNTTYQSDINTVTDLDLKNDLLKCQSTSTVCPKRNVTIEYCQ
jgi:hypothetical protein